jgi:uncharacterized protein (TIGR03083 family)
MHPVEPIQTVHLFPPLHGELLDLLRALPPADWERATVAPGWSVRDLVAHLLDTDLRRLASGRDGLAAPTPAAPITTHRELVAFLDELNATWVVAARRLSPRVLTDLHALVGPQVAAYLASRDPDSPATGVAWAGEAQSPAWFDTAREYTEKWLHQQQIRDAVGAPLLIAHHWLHPALDTFVRGLPHTFRTVTAPPETSVTLTITEPLAESWTVSATEVGWRLFVGADPRAVASVTLDPDIAWRVFTKGLAPAVAQQHAELSGDPDLAAHVLELVAIMA